MSKTKHDSDRQTENWAFKTAVLTEIFNVIDIYTDKCTSYEKVALLNDYKTFVTYELNLNVI